MYVYRYIIYIYIIIYINIIYIYVQTLLLPIKNLLHVYLYLKKHMKKKYAGIVRGHAINGMFLFMARHLTRAALLEVSSWKVTLFRQFLWHPMLPVDGHDGVNNQGGAGFRYHPQYGSNKNPENIQELYETWCWISGSTSS